MAVVGFDALPVMLKAIKAGEANATVRQDPARMGKEGVDLILKLLKGEKVEPKTMIPGVLITKDNVDQVPGARRAEPAAGRRQGSDDCVLGLCDDERVLEHAGEGR